MKYKIKEDRFGSEGHTEVYVLAYQDMQELFKEGAENEKERFGQ